MSRTRRLDPRLERRHAPSLNHARQGGRDPGAQADIRDVTLDCGWGRLVLAHTFDDAAGVARALQDEPSGRRNIAIYVHDPQVILLQAPQRLFLDPSHTFRMWLDTYRAPRVRSRPFRLRRLATEDDAEAINRLYRARQMVPADPAFIWRHRSSRNLTYVVAEDRASGDVIGTVTGIDHVHAFGDPERGSSLWCLAVDPQAAAPGIGQALVRYLLEHYQARGRAFLDLSVVHDNAEAIALYEKLGFERVPVFAVKQKNALNEPLFIAPGADPGAALNPYARIIVDEARRRGIRVSVQDAAQGCFRLVWGGTSVDCRESLTSLTSAVAMSRCQDKALTLRLLRDAGLDVPAQRRADGGPGDEAFLAEHGAVVVKPAHGEQGADVHVDIRNAQELREAVAAADTRRDTVLLERYCPGQDLRVVVIDGAVAGAAVRRPPRVTGTGRHTVRELIEKLSRRRAAATGGESRIPLDAETERCVRIGGHGLDDVPAAGAELTVRKTANLHTGGTLHDVTDALHPELAAAAIAAARVLDLPVAGLDLMAPAVDGPEHVIIEANERPGLANHEPRPTAQRFLDLLFPGSGLETHDKT